MLSQATVFRDADGLHQVAKCGKDFEFTAQPNYSRLPVLFEKADTV